MHRSKVLYFFSVPQTCLNSPDPPPVPPSADQRMSATGYEETELTYNVNEEEQQKVVMRILRQSLFLQSMLLQVRQMMYSSHYSSHAAQHTHNLFSPTASSYSAHSPYITPHHPHPAPSPSPGSRYPHIWHSHPNQAAYFHIRAWRLIRPGCHKAGFERRCLLQGRTTTNTQESPCLQVSPTPPPTIFLTLRDLHSPPTSRSTIPPDEPNPDLRGLPVFPECSAWEKHDRGPHNVKGSGLVNNRPRSLWAVSPSKFCWNNQRKKSDSKSEGLWC